MCSDLHSELTFYCFFCSGSFFVVFPPPPPQGTVLWGMNTFCFIKRATSHSRLNYGQECCALHSFFFVPFTGKDESDTIGPEGVEKLCKDLGVDPEDVRLLCCKLVTGI